MGFTFDHEQGRRDKMHDAYMNGSYALRGPGILDTTWQDYAKATGDASYKDWANMDNAQRTNLVRKFMGWYLDPVISKFDLSKLSQRQRNMIADIAWEYGQNSDMVKDAYAAFTSGDPSAFVNLKNNVGNYFDFGKAEEAMDGSTVSKLSDKRAIQQAYYKQASGSNSRKARALDKIADSPAINKIKTISN